MTMSVLPEITVDICSACHPFFTGQQKFVDTEGRIQKFQKKVDAAKDPKPMSKRKIAKKAGKNATAKPSSLKDMLSEARANH